MKTLIEELFSTIRASTNSVTVVSPSCWCYMWFSSNDFSLGNTSSDSSEKIPQKSHPPVDPRKSNEIT
jgi:hypothetical protein